MVKYRQLELFFDDMSKKKSDQSPCPGCKAKSYDEGRWFKILKCCVWCSKDQDVVRSIVRRPLEIDQEGCFAPPGSSERIAAYASRVARGLSCFSPVDIIAPGEPSKRKGNPGWCHAEGETGVERYGAKWRARPFWRGRRWMLGTFELEEDALSCVRSWWKMRKGIKTDPPEAWVPCGDGEKWFAIEKEHVQDWIIQYKGVTKEKCVEICLQYKKELSKSRSKPLQYEVWTELIGRLGLESGKDRLPDQKREDVMATTLIGAIQCIS